MASGPLTAAAVALSVLAFLVALRLSGILRMVADSTDAVRRAVAVIRDGSLDEEVKERLVRQWAIILVRRAAAISLVSTAIIGTSFLALVGFHASGLVPLEDSLSLMLSWETMGIVAVLSGASWAIGR